MMWKSFNASTFNMLTVIVVYKIIKSISIYRKYICNLSQKNFDLFLNLINTKIIIVTTIDLDWLNC